MVGIGIPNNDNIKGPLFNLGVGTPRSDDFAKVKLSQYTTHARNHRVLIIWIGIPLCRAVRDKGVNNNNTNSVNWIEAMP